MDFKPPVESLASQPSTHSPQMLYDEEKVKDALATLSPAEAAQSKVLQASFQEFFGRGTLDQCRELLPVNYKVSSPISASKPSARAPRKVTVPDATSYFLKNGLQPSPDLLAIVNGLADAKELPSAAYETLWASSDSSNGTDSSQRLSYLVQDYETCFRRTGSAFDRAKRVAEDVARLEDMNAKSTCALRLSLLIFSHEVDRIAATVPRAELSPGIGRKTVAMKKIAQCGMVELEKVKKLVKRRKNYHLMATIGGIGSLLEMGSCPASWEKLTKNEIFWVCQYRTDCLPDAEKRSRLLDYGAACTIISGLLAYGWTYDELAKGGSDLMDLLSQYVDLKELGQGRIVPASTMTATDGQRASKRRRVSGPTVIGSERRDFSTAMGPATIQTAELRVDAVAERVAEQDHSSGTYQLEGHKVNVVTANRPSVTQVSSSDHTAASHQSPSTSEPFSCVRPALQQSRHDSPIASTPDSTTPRSPTFQTHVNYPHSPSLQLHGFQTNWTNEHTATGTTAVESSWQQALLTPLPPDPTRGVSLGRASVYSGDGLANSEANRGTFGAMQATKPFGPASPDNEESNSDGSGGMGTEDEAMTPPSVMMREYWQTGEWDLLNFPIS